MTKPTPAATAKFTDSYGTYPMELRSAPSKRHGQRVTIYQWHSVSGCAHAGYVPTMFPEKAIGNAKRDRRFSDVVLL